MALLMLLCSGNTGNRKDLQKKELKKRLCYICRKPGHKARFCPVNQKGDGVTGTKRTREESLMQCIYCGLHGHFGWECRHFQRMQMNKKKRMKTV